MLSRSADVPTRRVLILVENLPVPFDRRVWQEATALTAAGYQVSVVCPTGKGYEKRREDLAGIYISRYPQPPEGAGALGYVVEYALSVFWMTLLSWRVFLTRGIDVIHACNPPDLLFLVALPFKLFGCRFVFDHHDINPELFEAKFGKRGWLHGLICWFERVSFLAADISIATNESYRQIALGRGRMRPERVFVVRSGPDLQRLHLQPPQERLKGGRRFLVGYVGVMGRQEGIELLLRAVHHIVTDLGRGDIQFVLVGGGTSLEELRILATDLGVSPWVAFTGRVPDSELLAVLNTAEVCVNPDVANEMNDKSTMNKIMEYMALGKPIVQFDLTEGRVSAGEASLYARRNDPVDLGDKLVQLLDDPERRRIMGDHGRRRVLEVLEWRHEAPKLIAAYASLWAG
jgi:glycosyltransferase involved in cell wall biosynthesis